MRSLNALSNGKLLLIFWSLFEVDKVTMAITQIIIKAAIIIVTSPPSSLCCQYFINHAPKSQRYAEGYTPLGGFWFLSIFRIVSRQVEAGVGVEFLEFDLGLEAVLGFHHHIYQFVPVIRRLWSLRINFWVRGSITWSRI